MGTLFYLYLFNLYYTIKYFVCIVGFIFFGVLTNIFGAMHKEYTKRADPK